MREFKGVDFYAADGLFSEEELMVRDTVRSFVTDRLLPLLPDCWERGVFPKQLIPAFGDLGLMSANLQGYGCAGMSNTAYGLALQELERGDSGVRSFCSVQGALVMYPIHTFGSEEQKKKYLPKLAKAELIGCFGLTEPDFGSNPGGMRTTAKKVGNDWVLNGSKQWITNGTLADVAVVWAKTNDGHDDIGIRGFVVEKGTPGFTASDQHGKFSLRASTTSELGFQDCRIPAENLLPETTGLKNALMCLNQARYGISWGGVGSAMETFNTALQYSKERIQWNGQPIACHQLVQEKLAWMATEISKGQLLNLQLGRLKDNGRLKHWQIGLPCTVVLHALPVPNP